MQSLNSELESKDADLQALQERCLIKDEQVAALGQQVAQLESNAEAEQHADAARQKHNLRECAVDVSLDQGLGLAPAHIMPSSPTALRQRVQALEV